MKRPLRVLWMVVFLLGFAGSAMSGVLTFDDLDIVARPVDPEIFDGYGGLDWAFDDGSGPGWILAYQEAEARTQYGYPVDFPSGDYAARVDSLNHSELIISVTGSKTFDFQGAKFHGVRYTTAGHQNCWAEVLDFTGRKSDGSIIRKLNIPVSRTLWSSISFPDLTGLVELRIMGRSPSHPGVAFANSMWLMDDFNYTLHLSECAVKRPRPWLVLKGKEKYTVRGTHFIRWLLSVKNYAAYPDALFSPAPTLPPCGSNANSSRTWVEIFDQSGKRLYGFCAMDQAGDMKDLWFATPVGDPPPRGVYVVIWDRLCRENVGDGYKSNLVSLSKKTVVGPYKPVLKPQILDPKPKP